MSKIQERPFINGEHGTFNEEWMAHKKSQDWWYCTGFLHDAEGTLYSYQFTILRLYTFKIRPYLLMMALTDFEAGRHYYYQTISFTAKHFRLTTEEVAYGDLARVVKGESGMKLTMQHKRFSMDLDLDYGKGAVWHCDAGNLKMGLESKRHWTQYYSYPNMPTEGILTLRGKQLRVRGKTWFDKQYGPFPVLDRYAHWEWFSLRFDDEEEIMLFSFPQDSYVDGTYMMKDASSRRLNNYTIEATEFTKPDGRTTYASAWKVTMPGAKEENYTIKPLLEGQMNMGYYELPAGIYNAADERVGLCFVELLPGVYNKKFPVTLFKKADQE